MTELKCILGIMMLSLLVTSAKQTTYQMFLHAEQQKSNDQMQYEIEKAKATQEWLRSTGRIK